MPNKLTNKDIDKKLKGRNIIRLDDYFGNKIKIRWLCMIDACGCIWKATSKDVFGKNSGCPRCAGLEKLTNEIVDERIANKHMNIQRLGECRGGHTKIKWQCLKIDCNFIWEAAPSIVLYIKSGCPLCSKRVPITNEMIDARLVNLPIKRVGNVSKTKPSKTKITFQCTKDECGYIWDTAPANILNAGNGCPKCSNQLPLTNNIIDTALQNQERKIKRLDDSNGGRIKIRWQCTNDKKNCNHIWLASPGNVIGNRSGCPCCKLKKNEHIAYTMLKNANIAFEIQKWITDITYTTDNIKADFYLPEHKTIIEYNGHQHYQPVCFGGINERAAIINFDKQQIRDDKLRDFCSNNHIKLIFIDGRTYHEVKLEKYMLKEIIPTLAAPQTQTKS